MLKNNKTLILFLAIALIVIIYALTGDKTQQDSVISKPGLHIQSWTGEQGNKVLYVEAPELPIIDVRIVFDAGSARDGDKPGLASMTNLLLDHGAGNWSTNEIVERFDDVGAQFSVAAYRDMAVVNLRSLTDDTWLKAALETMSAILQKPRFDENELQRERQRVMVALHNQQEDPGDIAELAFYEAVYGKHPYAIPTLGTEESLVTITRDDLLNFYQQYYVAKNAVVVIVGAVDKKQAERIAEQLISGLPAGKAAEDVAPVSALEAASAINKQHPSTQTTIWVGQTGMARKDADYFPLYVGNHILGGSGFGSRVVEEIREKRGLAYSSYTYFLPMRREGPFIMGLQTKNDQAEQALEVLRQTLNNFIAEGPTEAELVSVKNNITGGFALRLDSNKDITEYVAMIGFYDLPLDYLTTFNSRVEAVTVEQIQDAFKRRVHPDKMVTVLVGDLAKTR